MITAVQVPFACGDEGTRPSELTASDLVGAYGGKPFGRLTLAADGTFTAQDWPDPDALDSTSSGPQLSSAGGTWTLKPEGNYEDLSLDFMALGYPTYSVDSSVAGSRRQPRIYRSVGDPDRCDFHTLRRTER